MRQNSAWKKVKEDHSEELHVYGMIILEWVLSRVECGSWIELAEVRDMVAFAGAVVNIRLL